ncbi:CsbD family protein [Sphingomonas sp. GB1N7]|uniref:CsbD family protein n=1 Tax=Parasphingomonas caseinilytica TaxID=3096158 RepID=UPI002FC943E0
MNTDILRGATTEVGGKIKEAVGGVIRDKSLQSEGVAEQFSGSIQKAIGETIDAVEHGIRPLIYQVRKFSKNRPFTTAAVVGVLGIAFINTLRDK